MRRVAWRHVRDDLAMVALIISIPIWIVPAMVYGMVLEPWFKRWTYRVTDDAT